MNHTLFYFGEETLLQGADNGEGMLRSMTGLKLKYKLKLKAKLKFREFLQTEKKFILRSRKTGGFSMGIFPSSI